MSTNPPIKASAARGALVALAVGDALGWPQEPRGGLVGGQPARDRREPAPHFSPWARYAGYYKTRYRDEVEAGEYSDDTQLALAVARSCLTGRDWYRHLTSAELPAWTLYQRGGGGAVLSAVNSWATDGIGPWHDDGSARRRKIVTRYRGAGANGVAMRIAPHAIVATSERDLTERVLRDGFTTHGHPRALAGALVYGFALRHALESSEEMAFGELLEAARRGLVPAERAIAYAPEGFLTGDAVEKFVESWHSTCAEVTTLLEHASASLRRGAASMAESTLESLGCRDPKVNGAGTVTAAAAIYVASRFAARPSNGLITAAFFRKGDTDTLASMSGALLGAIHGTRWLGELAHTVQDADYISALAGRLVDGSVRRDSAEPPNVKEVSDHLRASAARRGVRDEGRFADGRRYTIASTHPLDGGRQRLRLQFEDGQTAVHDPVVTVPVDVEETHPHPRQTGADPADATDAADAADAAPANREGPQSALDSSGVVSVISPTSDLSRALAFYARVLGRDIARRGDEAWISDWFCLRQSAHAGTVDSLLLTLVVDDVAAALDRLHLPEPGGAHPRHLRDPDGRYVRLEPPRTLGPRAAVDRPPAPPTGADIPVSTRA